MKYNSIGEQLIAKAKELDPNYKPDKFNDMSEAIDILLNNSGSGSDDFIDLVIDVDQFESWVNPDTWNLTIPANTITTDMLLSIAQDGKKGILLKITMPHPDEEGQEIFCAIIPFYCDFVTGAFFTNVTNIFGKIGCWIGSVDEVGQDQVFKFHTTTGSKIWYDLDSMSGTITQNQYDEIKALVDTNSLAGIAFKTLSIYYPLANIFDGGIFVFRGIALGLESTGSDRKNAIDESTITIKPDLSITFSLEEIFFPVLTQGLSNQSIISVKTDGYQENLSIGEGLKVENGVLTSTLSNFKYGTLCLNNITQGDDTLNIELSFFDYIYDSIISGANQLLGTSLTRDTFPQYIKQNKSIDLIILLIDNVLTLIRALSMMPYFNITVSNDRLKTYFYNCPIKKDGSSISLFLGNQEMILNTSLTFDDNFTIEYKRSWYGD